MNSILQLNIKIIFEKESLKPYISFQKADSNKKVESMYKNVLKKS